MPQLSVLWSVVPLAALGLTLGCAGGGGASAAGCPPEPASVADVVESGCEGPASVRGSVHVGPEGTRLCEALGESYPPVCGSPRLTLEGFDADAGDVVLESSDGPGPPVRWSAGAVVLRGELTGDVLRLD